MCNRVDFILKHKISPVHRFIFGLALFFCQVNTVHSQINQLPNLPKANKGMIQSMGQSKNAMSSMNDAKEVFSKIQAHKDDMEKLKKEVSRIKELKADSIQYDSLVQGLKSKVLEQSEAQSGMLSEMTDKVDDEGLINSISYVRSSLETSAETLKGKVNMEQIEGFMDQSEENMKALVDEHLVKLSSDPLEEYLASVDIKEKAKSIQSFYNLGIDEYLSKFKTGTAGVKDLKKEEVQWKIIESGKEKLGSELEGKGLDGKMASIKNIKKPDLELKLLKEPNPYKGKPFFSRMNYGIYYDAIQGFSSGVHLQGHIGWRINQYFMPYAGMILKAPWKSDQDYSRQGYGYQGGVRMNFGNWLGQAGVEGTYSQNCFNGITGLEKFEGWTVYPIVSGGREVKITKSLKTVFLGYVDPLYNRNKTARLHSHMFGLKIGIELH